MLPEDDIRIDLGRAQHGGNFIRLVHIPTGIERIHPGPLTNVNVHELQKRWLAEIETELVSRGLTKYVVDAYPTKSTWHDRKRT